MPVNISGPSILGPSVSAPKISVPTVSGGSPPGDSGASPSSSFLSDVLKKAQEKKPTSSEKKIADARDREDKLRAEDRANELEDRENERAYEEKLRREQQARDDSAFSRLYAELNSLGINPSSVIGSASPVSFSGVSGSPKTSKSSRSYSTPDPKDDGPSLRDIISVGMLFVRMLGLFR